MDKPGHKKRRPTSQQCYENPVPGLLKGQYHEIYVLQFFSLIAPIWALFHYLNYLKFGFEFNVLFNFKIHSAPWATEGDQIF